MTKFTRKSKIELEQQANNEETPQLLLKLEKP